MKRTVEIGLLQMHCGKNPDVNMERAITGIKKLAKRGAQIICLPELFKDPYFCQEKRNKKYFDLAESVPGPTTKILGDIAEETKTVIIASIFEKGARDKHFNTAVVIDVDGTLKGKYRKMHIPNDLANHYDEAFYFDPGNLGFQSFQTAYAKVGPMICYDQWFPEGARITASKGAQILFYPTAIGFPSGRTRDLNEAERDAWLTIQQSHAIANNVFVVTVNRVGPESYIKFWGSSFVCDPYGRIITQAPRDKEADFVARCDMSLIEQKKRDWPFLNERRVKL